MKILIAKMIKSRLHEEPLSLDINRWIDEISKIGLIVSLGRRV